METMYDNTKKSILTNTTKEDSVYFIKFYGLNNRIEQLKHQRQQLISFFEDKIKLCNKDIKEFSKNYNAYFNLLQETNTILKTYQEALDFINKGGKDE